MADQNFKADALGALPADAYFLVAESATGVIKKLPKSLLPSNTGAKGDKGDTGDTGPQGPPGGGGGGSYTLPAATPSVLGGVKVGAGLTINGSGVASTVINQTNTFLRKRVFNVLEYGAVGDNSTENTAAFTACMAALIAAGGGVFYMPAGVYIGRILIPPVNFPNWISIEIMGEGRPVPISGTVTAAWVDFPYSTTTLKCTEDLLIQQGFATNRNAVITCASSATNFAGFSHIYLAISNLEVRTKTAGSIHGIDAENVSQFVCENVVIGNGVYSPNGTITNFTKGLITPRKDNAAWTRLMNVCVYGYNDGIEVNEHTDGDNITVTACYNGIFFNPAYHTSRFGRVCAQNNIVNIDVRGSHRFQIENLNIEHAVGVPTQITQKDVNDPTNLGQGYIYYGVVKAGLGQDTTFTKTGGTGITCKLFGTF